MLSPQLKTEIDKLWNRFWSSGVANPLTAIEQITYLIFLKRLEDQDNERAAQSQGTDYTVSSLYDEKTDQYRWSRLFYMPGDEALRFIQGPVMDWLKHLPGAEEQMQDAVFVLPNANLLRGAMDAVNTLFISGRNQDTLGDIFEYLLSEIATAGKNGQFRTPRHIIRAMCELTNPQLGERICDPACGTAGFLVNAYQHILQQNTSRDILEFEADGTSLNLIGDRLSPDQHDALRQNHFFGFDFDRTMVRLGWMNMVLHGLENAQVRYGDTLGSKFNEQVRSDSVGHFDVILANPPFTGSLDKSDVGESLRPLGTNKTELLFLELILQLLRPGGRAAVIVPEGVLFGSTTAHRAIRERLLTENQLDAVVSLPSGVFQPYTGVKTSILLFTKGGSTERVWFYDVTADGYTLNARRAEQPEKNDLWDLTLHARAQFAPLPFPITGDTPDRPFRLVPWEHVPAFVPEDDWLRWRSLPFDDAGPEREGLLKLSLPGEALYFQPQFVTERREIDPETPSPNLLPETVEVRLFQTLQPVAPTAPKHWFVETATIRENDFNLSAGRYKAAAAVTDTYEPPADLIRQLQAMEEDIQKDLGNLLAMVENRA
jgi:type I restriction enzyme M protein